MADALICVDDWISHPNTTLVLPSQNHWSHFRGLLGDLGQAGKLTTDAHLAAIAISQNATLVSADNDFAKFPGLQWENPLADPI